MENRKPRVLMKRSRLHITDENREFVHKRMEVSNANFNEQINIILSEANIGSKEIRKNDSSNKNK